MTDHVDLEASVLHASGARAVVDTDVVQSLWSGYGQIVRCDLDGGSEPSVIVKHVRWPDERDHPYGWSSDRSHERKLHSYQVETEWYDRYAQQCTEACRVPRRLALETQADGVVMILEDLDASGFAGRRQAVTEDELDACLSWLGNFHATFMGERPEGLWTTGTYWHLDTRPDELAVLEDGSLKEAAPIIDRRLADSPFQTFVHGDAKLANFCFDETGSRAAAVDFQYVGCGMKDVAYFISSCLDEDESDRMEQVLLDRYFELLHDALERSGKSLDFAALEDDWRALYPVAWTDFYRFLQGWSPGHWKLHRYSERLAREVLGHLVKRSTIDLAELADLAIVAATDAGRMIARSRPEDIQHKDGHTLSSQVVTEIDTRSEAIIVGHLDPTFERFELGLLTEEQEDDGGRLRAHYFWCVDPLDGTLAFIEGTPGYAVSIALVAHDGTPWIGVVYDPVEATLLHAVRGGGIFRDGEPWAAEPKSGGDVLSVFADRSFLAMDSHDAVVDALEQIARDMGLSGLQFHRPNGAVMNACGVLANAPACYFKFPGATGGGSLWDFAATACLFHETGAIATDIHGVPLDLNRADSSFMNHRGVLFASDEALAERIRTFYSGARENPS